MFFLTDSSSSGGYIQLIVMLLVFVVILYASYAVTRWLAKKGVLGSKTKNITFVESYRVNQNKQIAIIRIGKRYHAVGITKEHLEYLTEIPEEELQLEEEGVQTEAASFREVLKNSVKGVRKNGEKNNKNSKD